MPVQETSPLTGGGDDVASLGWSSRRRRPLLAAVVGSGVYLAAAAWRTNGPARAAPRVGGGDRSRFTSPSGSSAAAAASAAAALGARTVEQQISAYKRTYVSIDPFEDGAFLAEVLGLEVGRDDMSHKDRVS